MTKGETDGSRSKEATKSLLKAREGMSRAKGRDSVAGVGRVSGMRSGVDREAGGASCDQGIEMSYLARLAPC